MWKGSPAFQAELARVLEPACAPERFGPALPPRRLVALFSACDAVAVVQACALPVPCVVVPAGAFDAATAHLADIGDPRLVEAVVVLPDADRLVYEPESEWALQLPELAEQRRLLVVGLFARGPAEPSAVPARYRTAVWAAFGDARLYLGPPDSAWRAGFIERTLAELAQLRPCRVEVDADARQQLADRHTGDASPALLLRWLRAPFYRNEDPITLGTLLGYLRGGQLMVADALQAEGRLHEAAQLGPREHETRLKRARTAE